MRKVTATKERPATPPKGRMGRPPRDLAGEVEERILEAARGVFLERGLSGASIDEISRRARAAKATIYGRFPTKEALFAAVILHGATRAQAQFASDLPSGGTVEERLIAVGASILRRLLSEHTIDFMRLSAAEARHFPELADVGRNVRENAARATAELLAGIAGADEAHTFPGLAPPHLEATTRFFLDLVVSRLLLRALLGEPLEELQAEAGAHVRQGVGFFLRACSCTPK